MRYVLTVDPFAALADPVRRDLLGRLRSGPARVVDLAAHHEISRPAVSRHLRVLTEAGLVSATDHGRERHYRLERGGLAPVADLVAALLARPRFGPGVLDGLDLEVRRTTREHREGSPEPVDQPSPTSEEDTA